MNTVQDWEKFLDLFNSILLLLFMGGAIGLTLLVAIPLCVKRVWKGITNDD